MQRILLLDPDSERSHELAFLLRRSGFFVDVREGGMAGTATLRQSSPDLVLVAEHCPTLQDRQAARLVFRLFGDVPKIVLGEEGEEVAGIPYLEMGADAYLPRPLNTRVLLARIRSMLYRFERRRQTESDRQPDSLPYSDPPGMMTQRGARTA